VKKIGGKSLAKYRQKSAKKSTKIMMVPRLPSTAVNVPLSLLTRKNGEKNRRKKSA
jgi:hypothetical protein